MHVYRLLFLLVPWWGASPLGGSVSGIINWECIDKKDWNSRRPELKHNDPLNFQSQRDTSSIFEKSAGHCVSVLGCALCRTCHKFGFLINNPDSTDTLASNASLRKAATGFACACAWCLHDARASSWDTLRDKLHTSRKDTLRDMLHTASSASREGTMATKQLQGQVALEPSCRGRSLWCPSTCIKDTTGQSVSYSS